MHYSTLLALAVSFAGLAHAADSWPGFLGPNASSVVEDINPPTAWSDDEGITWSTEIHGRGWSSPVVMGNQVWITTATEDGTELSALCLDVETGDILFDSVLFRVEEPQFAHRFNSYASPSPAIEEGAVYITFGSPGTARVDTETFEVEWTREDLECDHFRGAGSSPILYNDLLILNYDGADHQYVVAFNKHTGDTVWRADRSVDFQDITPEGLPRADGDFRKAYCTPIITSLNGNDALISPGANATYVYNPQTGEEIWRHTDRSAHSVTARPLARNEMAYVTTGFSKGTLLALDLNVPQDSVDESVEWAVRRNVPNKPSPILLDDRLYMIDDGGIATAVDVETGETIWNERVGGNYSASPLALDDILYFFSEEGKTTLVRASDDYEVIAENTLGDGFMATPAVHQNALILRGRTHLYRIDPSDSDAQ